VVARCTDRDDVVFGSVFSGRLQGITGSNRVLGMFVNTLPLRVKLAGRSARELVLDVKQSLLELLRHEQASLALAQRCSGVPQGAPLFSAVLNYRHSAPEQDVGQLGLEGVRLLASQERTNYPLSVSVDDFGMAFGLSTQTQAPAQAQAIHAYLSTALSALLDQLAAEEAGHATPPLAHIDVLPAEERTRILNDFSGAASGAPGLVDTPPLAHALFEAHARRHPQALALQHGDRAWTCAQLDAQANQLARHLRTLGVGPDRLVAILVERGPDMIVGLLATLKAGGAYVPLDPSYPAQRLRLMLDDAQPCAVLVGAATRAGLDEALPPDLVTRVVDLDVLREPLSRQDPSALPAAEVGLHGQHLAYVIYTSGSTGRPKGVMVEHRGVSNLAHASRALLQLDERSRVLQYASFSFDASAWEWLMALSHGASLHLADPPDLLPGPPLQATLANAGITHVLLSPAVLSAWPLGDSAQGLHTLIAGGDACPTALARQYSHLPRFINAYGPTEASVCVSLHTWCASDDGGQANVPIGRPLPHTRLHIVDAAMRPVPIGVPGEIVIGGIGVARGYLNRPELTAEHFVADPFDPTPGARLYKTGDLGRWRSDGVIEHLGRKDQQIKVRGFRIEPGEIEAQLLTLAGVKAATVLALRSDAGDQRLVAYVAADPHATPQPQAMDLRQQLRQHLPEHMVPGTITVMDALPMTPSGKIDRQALPDPHLASALPGPQDQDPPRGPIEQAIAQVWSSLLNTEHVHRGQNFFDLGGHSLLIVQMVARLRGLGLAVEVRDVLASTSLADLAGRVHPIDDAAAPTPGHEAHSLIPPDCSRITPDMVPLACLEQHALDAIAHRMPGGAANVQDIYPLAPLQEGLVFHHLLDADRVADPYVLPMVFTAESSQQLDAFMRALQSVIDRHDILRTAVQWQALPHAVQVVARHAMLPVSEWVLDSSGDPVQALMAHMDQAAPLRIDQAPLARAFIARQPQATDHPPRWHAALQMHHLVCDHVSQEVMLAEVRALLGGQGGSLAQPIPYRAFLTQALDQHGRMDAQTHFTQSLGEVSEPTLPFGLADVRGGGAEVPEHRVHLPIELARRIRQRAQQSGVGPAALFHAAWALVVGQCAGRDDVVFGSVLSGRLQGLPGIDRALGLFINTLPLRVRLDQPSAFELIAHTHRALMALLPHEQSALADALRCSPVPFGTPLFSAVINYRHSAADLVAPRFNGIELLASRERSNYPFALSVDDLASGFMLTAQSPEPTRVTAYVRTALESLLDACDQADQGQGERPIASLSILSSDERERLLHTFQPGNTPAPGPKLIHAWFEAQAQRTPDAPALRHAQGETSYRALNEQANRLARWLRTQGLGRDRILALLMDKGPDVIVAMLAALKAGGAYLAIDPAYPADRIRDMLADAEPTLVLSQQCLAHLLPRGPQAPLLIEELSAALGQHSQHNLTSEVQAQRPDELAYVVYTSGSTGRPKGVMVAHEGLCHLAAVQGQAFSVGPGSRVLQFAALGFDACVWEWVMALAHGATLHLASRDDTMPGQPLQNLLRDQAITHLTVPPVALAAMDPEQPLPTLQVLVTAGEACPPELVRRWAPGRRFFNAYGPSEATVCATLHACSPGEADGATAIPIGQPIAHTQVHVLDAQGRPAPIGVAGEIHIGGLGVALGYLNRPELTQDKFIPDTLGGRPGARLYKTGDLGRWRELAPGHGVLHYLGRAYQQVKPRGPRLQLVQIQAPRARQPGRPRLAVALRRDAKGEPCLVAYLTRQPDTPAPDDASLRAALRQHLPDVMVPSAFMTLAALPQTPNGKVDKKVLPDPTDTGLRSPDTAAPRHGTESALATLWCEVLGVTSVGRQDHFFDLGGHSLRAVQLVTRVQHGLHRQLTLRQVFDAPVLADMAALIDATPCDTACQGVAPAPLPRADRSGPLPLSWAQHRLWFLNQFPGASSGFFRPLALQLPRPARPERAPGQPGCPGRAPRIAAHPLRHRRWPARAGDHATRGDPHRADRAGHGQVGSPPADGPGPLRPDPGPPRTRTPAQAGGRRAPAAGHPAPHHRGWLVTRRADARTGPALCRPAPGPAVAAGATASPIRRLCPMAAGHPD